MNNKQRHTLLCHTWLAIAISLCTVILHETGTLAPGNGLGGNPNQQFIVLSASELFTICLIPLAMRLFKFTSIAKATSSAEGKTKWSHIRLAMITIPMVANTLLYYIYMHVAFGYMAIIALFCLFFIYPGKARCINENTEER